MQIYQSQFVYSPGAPTEITMLSVSDASQEVSAAIRNVWKLNTVRGAVAARYRAAPLVSNASNKLEAFTHPHRAR